MKTIKNILISAAIILLTGSGCTTPSYGDNELQAWYNKLSGGIWQHYRSTNIGGNFSYEKTRLTFCPDGSTMYKDYYTGYEFYGNWSLSRNEENTPLLILKNEQNQAIYFALTIEDGLYYFKGAEYARLNEQAPCN